MKIRIGISGRGEADAIAFGQLADDIDDLGFDSIWLPEVLTQPAFDPFVALAWIGGHNPKLKLGTTALLPGRNPLRLAKQVSTTDVLTSGRFLLTLVPGLAQAPERDAVGVEMRRRGAVIEELLPVLRDLWAGKGVGHDGPSGAFPTTTLWPLPVQQPFDVWLGGMAHASLVRCGRIADGWLPSLCDTDEATSGKRVILEAADEAGREISPEHFGVNVVYAHEPLDDRVVTALAARSRGKDPRPLVPVGLPALREALERFIAIDFTKFVVRPIAPPGSWRAELEDLAGAVGDLQT
ncbi:MAG: LLM class flavin-dependent oxidoreductase [Acidimicrobiales bacterium]